MIRVSYIDSQMAKQNHQLSTLQPSASFMPRGNNNGIGINPNLEDTRQNLRHQLSEVDVEPMPKRAEKASRQPPRKPKLGRDGNPLRPRPRRRRNSEDIARDALVESVLHEHRLENVYQSPAPDARPETRSDDNGGEPGEHDERFAEKFRQDFLDQVAEKKQMQQLKQKAAAGGADKSQGPKLGGGRSARAKMLQQQQGQPSGKG
jgi:hypothetical protein